MSLKTEASQAHYVSACLGLVKNINRTSVGGLQSSLIKIVNRQLRVAGVPIVGSEQDVNSASNAEFNFQTWNITFGGPLMVQPTLSALRNAVNTVYHEARHCEQWYCMVCGAASGKLKRSLFDPVDNSSDAALATSLWVPERIARVARANPSYGTNTEREVNAWWHSVYASRGGIRGKKLAHINQRYEAYRNLPEEVDAWALGDGVEERFAASCPKLGCPTYAYWKKATSLFWYKRSSDLKEVDDALKAYEEAKSTTTRATLKRKFDAWYRLKEAKGGSKRGAGLDNAVDQLKGFLDQYGPTGAPLGIRVI